MLNNNKLHSKLKCEYRYINIYKSRYSAVQKFGISKIVNVF